MLLAQTVAVWVLTLAVVDGAVDQNRARPEVAHGSNAGGGSCVDSGAVGDKAIQQHLQQSQGRIKDFNSMGETCLVDPLGREDGDSCLMGCEDGPASPKACPADNSLSLMKRQMGIRSSSPACRRWR